MFKWLRRLWTRKKEVQPAPQAEPLPPNVVSLQDYAQNQHQLELIEKKLRAGDRPRGAA